MLVADRDKWHSKFSALQRVNYNLTFGCKRLTEQSKALMRDYAAHTQASKREMADLGNQIRSYYSATLVAKLKVSVRIDARSDCLSVSLCLVLC